jgi:hypothetical protein
VTALVIPIVVTGVREVPLRKGFEEPTVGDEASPQPATRPAAR